MRTCSKCSQVKSDDEFYKWCKSRCKSCIAEYKKKWYQANSAHVLAKHKEWVLKNAQRLAAYKRQWCQKNRGRKKQSNKKWRLKRPELALKASKESKRKWKLEHPEKYIESNRRYYNKNKERIAQYGSQWKKDHFDKTLAFNHRRRARKRNAPGFWTSEDIVLIRIEQQDKCFYCGINLCHRGTVDHKTPLIRQGTNWPNNLVLACKSCNSSKGTKTVEEFMKYLVLTKPALYDTISPWVTRS